MKRIVGIFVLTLITGNAILLGFIQTVSAAEPLTISGWVRHKNEAENLVNSRYIKVEAWEKQAIPLTDYKIAEGYTDDTGHFTFTHDTGGSPILNEDPGLGESGTRDLYIKCLAENEAARVSGDWFSGILGATWFAETSVYYDVAGPTWAISIAISGGNNCPAFGIPALVKADRDWLSSRTGGWARDQLSVLYPDTDWPNFFSIWFYNVMRIPDGWADDADAISHEYGHGVHYSIRGGLPNIDPVPIGEEDPYEGTPKAGQGGHWIFSESSGGFALTEGWADFFAAARHETQYLETNDYWMGADGNGPDGPNTDGTTGEIVEGAFASILWDLYDGANDDGVNGGFSNLWTVFSTDQPDRVWSSSANDDFYHYWIDRFGQTRAVDEIFVDHGIPLTDDSYDSGGGNDNSASASNLGTINTSKEVEDLIVTDVDWYKFTSSTAGNADSEVVIEFDKNRGNLDLFVYRSDETLVGTGTEFTSGKRVSLNGESPNTFKIKVVGAGDNSATSGIYEGDFSPDYDLNIVLGPLVYAIKLERVTSWYWTQNTRVYSVAVEDVDGDTDVETVTGGYYQESMSRTVAQLCVWSGSTMTLENVKTWYWGGTAGYTIIDSVAVGDVDGDGSVEIVTGGHYYDGRDIAQLCVWDGATLDLEHVTTWYWTSDTYINSISVHDVDADGSAEIVTGGYYWDNARWIAQLCVWSGSTLALEHVKVWCWTHDTAINSVAIGDVDADGSVEIVTGGYSDDGTRHNAELCVWSGSSLALENVEVWYWTNSTYVYSVAVGDVDADGSIEIVTGGYIWDGTRTVAQLCVWSGSSLALEKVTVWYWIGSTGISSVAVGDVDADGSIEIVSSGTYSDGTRTIAQLCVWDGATLDLEHVTTWYWTSDTYINSMGVGDVDGDGSVEIVTGGHYNDGTRSCAQHTVWSITVVP